MNDEQIWRECLADACKQGRCPCPCPNKCWQPVNMRVEFLLAAAIVAVCAGFVFLGPMVQRWFS